MDNFYEQLITTYKTSAYKIVNAGFYVFGFLALITLGALPIAIVCAILAGAAFFGKKKLYVEYEYVFTNGEIDVDKIVEMKKRSRAVAFNIKNVEVIALEDSDSIKSYSNKPSKVLNLYPKTNDKKVYSAMVTGGNERLQVNFVPDEEFLNLCYKYNPRAVKKY
ncbi:hypothetical protein NBE98_00395 [Clostridium swellfunianum]|uniref:hypothetical protein n=1 Tax=Clostridium swellfunianum TaxID=1367462 RepID=UPI0020300331|nr:hypothetical protein [Clostridium swellfunianum]MCM0646829.1 hypothetical protein [Clostridium swellfunianum]